MSLLLQGEWRLVEKRWNGGPPEVGRRPSSLEKKVGCWVLMSLGAF
jgi:hypothetical protein